MPENILQIIISAKDEATKVLGVTDKHLKNIGDSVSKVGNKFLIAGTAMAAGLSLTLKKAGDFQDQMSFVATMLGDQSDKYMPGFEASLKRMATTYGQSTATLSKGLYDILSASIPAEKAARFLEVSVRAAEAGFVEAGLTADALTTVINAYGLSASRASDISDWFFSIVEKGKTTMAELAPTIGLVLPLSKSLGVSLEEVGASLTVMTRAGIKTDIAVTSLRSIMGAFLKPTKELVEETKKWGFESAQAAMKQLGMAGVLERLAKVNNVRLPQMIEEKRALTGLLTILDKKNEFMEDSITISERAGKTDEMLAKREENLNVQMRKLRETVNILMVEVGTTLIPVVKDLAENIIKNIDKFKEFVTENEELIKNVAILAPAIALLSGAFLKTVGTALKMISIFSKIIPAMEAMHLASSGLMAVIGTAGLGAAIIYTSINLAKLVALFYKAKAAVEENQVAQEKYLSQLEIEGEKMKQWQGSIKGLYLLRAKLVQNGLDESSEEIKKIDERIERMRVTQEEEVKTGEAAREKAKIIIEASEEISEEEKKRREEKVEAEEELHDLLEELRLNEHELALARLDEDLEKFKETGAEKSLIEEYEAEKRKEIAEDERDKKDKIKEEEVKKAIEGENEKKEAFLSTYKKGIGLVTDYMQFEMDANKKRREDMVSSGKMTSEEAEKLNSQDKERFKAAKKAEALISGLLAIQKSYTAAAVFPPPLNMIIGVAQAALQIGITAMQVSKITAMGEGGIVTKPTLALIGEKGPEGVFPLTGGRFPMQTNIDVGDVVVNLNIERLEALNTENLEKLLKDFGRAVRERVIEAVELAQGIHLVGAEMEGLSV